jgi:hypothetical protein
MTPIQKVLRLTKYDYYEKHLSLVNPLLPIQLTPMEIKVLSRFMALEGDIAQYRFGTGARKIVKDNLGLSTAGLSNYMGSLTEKGFLVKRGEDQMDILPILFPDKSEQTYMFKLINVG